MNEFGKACTPLFAATTEEELLAAIFDACGAFVSASWIACWRGDPSILEAQIRSSGRDSVVPPTELATRVFQTGGTARLGDCYLRALARGGESYGVVALGVDESETFRDGWDDLVEAMALAIKNADGYASLEMLVQAEMATAVEREQAMQLVLDSMRDGLFVCGLDGRSTEVRSAAVERWLGSPEGIPMWTYLAGGDSRVEAGIQIGFEQIVDDFLPFEVSAAQLPSLIERGEQVYELEYHPVRDGDRLSELVVVVSDATQRIAAQRAEARQREVIQIVQGIVQNRGGFKCFLEDMNRIAADLVVEQDVDVQKRLLHTMKGNAGVFGFRSFAARCHEIEDEIAAGADPVCAVADLPKSWSAELEKIQDFLSDPAAGGFVIQSGEFSYLLDRLKAHGLEDLSRAVWGWRHERLSELLQPHALRAEQLAAQFGKQVRVEVDHQGLRIPSAKMRGFFASLVHVVRNAIDHGIESADERIAAGKAPTAKLTLGTVWDGRAFHVWVEDDGRGIDWSAVARKARQRGLPCGSQADLQEALFADGLSTRDEATETSGRGVGMSALRAECEGLGGSVRVTSQRGLGTRFEFAFPEPGRFLSLLPVAAAS